MAISQLNLNLVLTGAVSGATVGSSGSITVPTLFDLRSVQTPHEAHLYQTNGYWALNDGGAAVYYWDNTDTTSFDNGASIITVTGFENAGRLKLLVQNGEINVKQFGAIGDGTNRTITTSYNGKQRFASLAAVVSAMGTTKGTWAELLSTGDTLDAVGIQQALSFGIASGYVITVPQGGYRVGRGVWLGEYEHVDALGPTYKWWMKNGVTFRGNSYMPRQQSDGDSSVGILCVNDISNRWTLRWYNTGTLPTTGGVTLRLWWGSGQTTSLIPFNASPTMVKNIIEALTDVGTGKVTVSSPTGANIASGATYVITFARSLPTGTKSWHGEMKFASTTLNNSNYPVLYSDSGILNLRGQANQQWTVENMGLSSNWVNPSDDHYDASCGINLTNSTMNNHRFRGIRTYSCRWGIIMNENDGGNGESHLFEKVLASGCYGYLYMSGGQSYNVKHIYWECGSDGPIEAGDNNERVMVQIAPSSILGFSMDFISGETRFYDDPYPKQTFLKIAGVGTGIDPQHIGVINFISTRTEHITTLVNANFLGSWNHYGTVNFYGHEFTVRGSIASGHALIDDVNSGPPSQYKINVENCVFTPYDSFQDMYINIGSGSKSEVVFNNCTFTEFRSRKISAPYVKFSNCRYSDYSLSSTGRIRQWEETYDLRARHSNGRFAQQANNPWQFSGHAEQGLVNAAFLGASGGATTAPSGWVLVNGSAVSGQAFTDSGINVAGKSFTQFGAWGLGAFAFQLPQNYSLVQYLNNYPGSGDSTTRINMGYRTKVCVPSGSVEFRLEYRDSGTPIDSVVVTDMGFGAAPTIVTLHCQTNRLGSNEPPVLRIKTLTGTAIVQMWWQHTFQMGSPAVFAYSGEAASNDHWDGLLSSLRVTDRLALPSQTYTTVQGAGVPMVPKAGDTYYDSEVDRLLTYGNTWKPVGDSVVVISGSSASGLQYALNGVQALGQTLVASAITPVPTGVVFPNVVRTWTVVNGTPSGLGLYTGTRQASALIGVGKTAMFRGDGQNNIYRVTPDV